MKQMIIRELPWLVLIIFIEVPITVWIEKHFVAPVNKAYDLLRYSEMWNAARIYAIGATFFACVMLPIDKQQGVLIIIMPRYANALVMKIRLMVEAAKKNSCAMK